MLSDELGLGRPGGYHAWVGKTVHKIIEEVERGELPRVPQAITAAVDARWRPQEFPSIAVSEAFRYLAKTKMLKNWFDRYAETPPLAIEQYFEFEFEGATIVGYIDRIGPTVQGGTLHHRLQERRGAQGRQGRGLAPARHLLPRGDLRRGARGVPARHRRGARVPEGTLEGRHHRAAAVAGPGARDGGLPGAGPRRAVGADRPRAGADRRRAPTGRTPVPTATSASSSRSARSGPRAARCSGAWTRERAAGPDIPREIVLAMGAEPTAEQWAAISSPARAVRAGRRAPAAARPP